MAEVKTSSSDLIRIVRDIGFPAVVAFFVLWKLDGSIQNMTVEIQKLREAILTRPAASQEK